MSGKLTFSNCLGWIIICSLSMIFACYLEHCYNLSFEITIIIYVLSYYVFLWLVSVINNAVYSFVLGCKKYIRARICLLLTFIFDIEGNWKKWKVISYSAKGEYENLQKYFDVNDYCISHLALSIYAYNIDKDVVLEWFNKKYLTLKLQIPSEYEDIYRYIVENSVVGSNNE